jgi:hypothetical protein
MTVANDSAPSSIHRPWDPLLNVVKLPAGLDPTKPSEWLVPTWGSR